MKTYEVLNKTQNIVVKVTDDLNDATDYLEQCNRGSQRYHERNPDTELVLFEMREVE
jgi:hypothetical protein